MIFGPKPKDWSIKMNKKEKRLALSTAIVSAAGSGSSIVVEDFGDKFEKPKTREFIEAMKRWGLDPKVKSMFFMMELEENLEKSGRNIGTLKMLTPRSFNLYDVLDAERLVFTPATIEYLNQRYGVDNEDEDDDEEEYEEEEEGDDGDVVEDETPEASES